MVRTSMVLAGIVLILAAGCAPSPAVKSPRGTLTPELVQLNIREHQTRVRSMRGKGNITVETPEMAQSASFELALRKPDSVLVTLGGPFGISVGSALLTREKFQFYNSLRNELITGEMNAENVDRAFRLHLGFDELLDLFTGGTFLPEDRGAPGLVETEQGFAVLVYRGAGWTRRYWIDPATLLITRLQALDRDGRLVFEQRFENFRSVGAMRLPHYVRITQHRERRALAISYSSISVNDESLRLVFNVPSNAHRVRWR